MWLDALLHQSVELGAGELEGGSPYLDQRLGRGRAVLDSLPGSPSAASVLEFASAGFAGFALIAAGPFGTEAKSPALSASDASASGQLFWPGFLLAATFPLVLLERHGWPVDVKGNSKMAVDIRLVGKRLLPSVLVGQGSLLERLREVGDRQVLTTNGQQPAAVTTATAAKATEADAITASQSVRRPISGSRP